MSALDSAGVSAAAIPHTGGEEQSISIMKFLGAGQQSQKLIVKS
jgi:hypothetical protein